MIKWIVLAVAGYLLYRMFANDFLKKRKEDAKEDAAETERRVAAGEMVKDPECGAYVAVDASVTVRDGDRVLHFCGYDCRDRYLKRLEQQGREIPAGRSDD